MTKDIEAGQHVVLKHKDSELTVVGVATKDFKNGMGYSSHLELENIVGLPLESAVFNVNMWEIVGDTGFSKDGGVDHVLVMMVRDILNKRGKQVG